jgi:3-oxoacyl-[acyl-carrier-protein] synthase-3
MEGLKLVEVTYGAASEAFGWSHGVVDEYVLHQVSKVHTEALLGIDPARALTPFRTMGMRDPLGPHRIVQIG